MQDNARKITYGAMMIAMFAILLAISVYIPIVGGVVLFFIPLPIILYRLRYDFGASMLVTVTGVLLSVIVGGIIIVPYALLFGVLGLIIGSTIKTGKSKLYTFMASGLTILISVVLLYAGTVLLLGINIIDQLLEELSTTSEKMTEFMSKNADISASILKQTDELITFYEVAVPSMFMIASFGTAFIIVILNLAFVKRLGQDVPSFSPFREMKLPAVVVWSYLVVLLIGLFGAPEPGSTLYLTYVNAAVILRFLLLLQGLSLVHFYLNEKKSPKWLTVISTVFAILLSQITILLGVLDSGMNIRAWITRNKKN